MRLLYGLFYTFFSLAVVSAFSFLIIWLIRFIFIKAPKKYIAYLWWLFLIRSICPVSLSSIFSISSSVNRRFHIFLEMMGLTFDGTGGVLTGWQSVFIKPFTVNTNFRLCSIIWAAGVIFIWIYTFVKQSAIRKWLKNAKRLDGNIYQHERLNIPAMTGVIRLKKYLPGKMNVSEAKYILRHMEIHEKRNDGVLRAAAFLVLSIQWFNPFMWCAFYFIMRDIETAADEETLNYFRYNVKTQDAAQEAMRYAQEIINMDKGNKVIRPSLVTFMENYIDDRAARMLYMEKTKKSAGQIVILMALLLFVWWFMLRPLRMMWEESYNGKENMAVSQTEEPLFKAEQQTVVAESEVKSADGLSKVVKIVMSDGKETASGYDGKFDVVLEDNEGNKIADDDLNQQFNSSKNDKLHFEKNMILHISDYNNDKVNEVAIGQEIEVNDDNLKALFGREPKQKERKKIKNIQKYYMWNIGADRIQCVSEPIYTTGKTGIKVNSSAFKVPKDTNGVIKIKAVKKKIYYVWDSSKEMYVRKELSKKQLKAYKKNADKSEEAGESSVHSLKDSEDIEKIRVVTQKDSTGSEAIKEIIAPDGETASLKKVKGYYCDLQWVQTSDKEEDRYAVLTYNGTKSQTFIVYDTKLKKVYYRQEDGNNVLGDIFKQYNGNQSDIAFNNDDIVVYTLQEKENDILKIGFAANAENNIVVKGSYKYDTNTKRQYEFSYTQTGATDSASTSAPESTAYAGN